MFNKELLDYIKQQLQEGISQQEIKNSLLANGWQEQDINEAFNFFNDYCSQLSKPTFLPGVIEIFKQALTIYKQNFTKFLGIMAIQEVIKFIFLLFLFFIFNNLTLPNALRALLFIITNIFRVFLLTIPLWGEIALIYVLKNTTKTISIIEAYKLSWHKTISFLLISALTICIIVGGFFLAFVPAIIFAVWFSLAVFILIVEDLKAMDALLKSREYVRGQWKSVFWRLFFVGAPFITIYLGRFQFYRVYYTLSFIEFIFFETIINVFLFPLIITYFFLVYKNIKSVKDSVKDNFIFKYKYKKNKDIFKVIAFWGLTIILIYFFVMYIKTLSKMTSIDYF